MASNASANRLTRERGDDRCMHCCFIAMGRLGAGSSSTGGASNGAASGGGGDAAGGQVLVRIRKARQGLRHVDEDPFTPWKVPIGAYHNHRGHSAEKRDVANRMLCPREGINWTSLRDELSQGRDWYPDIDNPSETENYFSLPGTDTGTWPLLEDGCYVLHFLGRYREAGTDVVIEDPYRVGNENSVTRDILFLLENQIPWSVLRGMLRWIRGTDDPAFREEMQRCLDRPILTDSDRALALALALDKQLADRVPKLLEARLYTISGEGRRRPVPSSPPPAHLLDLVHYYLNPTEEIADRTLTTPEAAAAPAAPAAGGRMGRWRRATEYSRYAFVEFKRRDFKQREVESVLDVCLDGGTLWIPTLRIDELTFTILRNLIALEDRMRFIKRPVTAYCLFMSQLACKVEDVELLQRLDILQNFLATDEDVVEGFAGLCKGVVFHVDDARMNYLNRTWHELHKRWWTPGYTLFGLFFEKYFSNSMHILAFIAAVSLFALEVAQVVLAALSYAKKK